jgi:glycosyltransferase involved in cell wall biosynthesis
MNQQISIIIPVLNESGIINFTIEHLYTLDSADTVEIIVVDGSPHGETINAITGSDVQKISGQKGRGSQMNQGAAVAGGDILLFLHADTRLSHDALNQIVAATKQPDVVGGAFDLRINSEKKCSEPLNS